MHRDHPETAIAASETLMDCRITLHDLDGGLRGRVDPQRLSHRHRRCLRAKAENPDTCIAFDVDHTRQALEHSPQGLLRSCPFGISEAVVPCFRDQRLAWVLFAGPIAEQRSAMLLEALRQLAARLRVWEDEHPTWPRGERVERAGSGSPDGRRQAIMRWIAVHHTQAVSLQDLAAALGLSRFQTSRSVQRLCGRSFPTLISEARLHTAQALLADTDLPMQEIARRCGFGDRSHFHRCFRTAHGMSPQQWRRHTHNQA